MSGPTHDDDSSSSRPRSRQVGRALFSVAVVAIVYFGVLPQIADVGEVWDQIQAMTPIELATLVLAATWNLVTYLFVVLPALPGLTWGQGVVVTQSTTAASNVLPAGAAVGIGMTYAMYSSWGFPRSESTLAILVSGVWNTFMKLGLPVLALALLALSGDANVARVTAGLVGIGALLGGIGVFWLMLRSDAMARRVGDRAGAVVSTLRRVVRRPPVTGWGEGAVRFRSQTIRLLRRSWVRLTVGGLVSHLSLFLVLLLTLRHVGVSEREVGWIEVLAAFAFVRLLSALPITPGGVGVVELGLTAALVAAGGDRAKVVAAVLVFRGLTYLLPVPVGVVCYAIWRRRSSWRKAPEPEPPPAPVILGGPGT
ncbi:MAG TPA: YbhN family protein [Acidimicrobiales bacterium]|nr:YbhN family protein [Acidimicrobiales bacterium]